MKLVEAMERELVERRDEYEQHVSAYMWEVYELRLLTKLAWGGLLEHSEGDEDGGDEAEE